MKWWNHTNTSSALRRLLLLALAVVLVAAACSGDDDEATAEAESADTTEAASSDADLADEQVLRMRLDSFPKSLDPAYVDRVDAEAVTYNVFNGLVRYDMEGKFEPDLAESWESNEDLTQWTFKLREGVMFHGEYGEMTADDVVFSYERIKDPATDSFHIAVFENVESFEAPDDHTFVANLASPDSSFLHRVAGYQGGNIVSRAAVEALGEEFATKPVGTGPFAVESYDAGNGTMTLVRHEDYYQGPATLTEVQLTEVGDNEAASIALENGEFDIAMDITGDQRLEQLKQAGFVRHERKGRSALVTMLNPEKQPAFADPRVRQAIAHAIDFKTIIDTLVPLREERSYNIILPTMPEYTDDVARYDYDPERAKELLAEAGYADGLTIKRLIRGTDGVEDRDLLEQEYLAAVGITEEFDTVEVSEFSERRFNGDFEMATRSNTEPNIDFLMTTLLHPSQFPPGGGNGSQYDNPEVTEMLEQARSTADEDERVELYQEIQRVVMEDLPYIPENTLNMFWPAWEYVDGVELNPQALLNLHKVRLLAH